MITDMVAPETGTQDCVLLGHSDGSITLINVTDTGINPTVLMHAGRQDG